MVLFIGLGIKLTGAVPGSRGRPDTPLDPETASMVLAGAVVLVMFLSAILGRRVARVRSLFERGREVEARVRKVAHFQGARTKLGLEFELNGMPYEIDFSFLRAWKTPEFGEDTRIPVLVDPDDPKRAIPLALYGDPSPVSG